MELPVALSVILGVISAPITQMVKKIFRERMARLGVAVFLSAFGGVVSYLIFHPSGWDAVQIISGIFGWSQLVYQFFKSLPEKR